MPVRARTYPSMTSTEPDFLSRRVSAHRRFHLDLDPSPALPLAVVCGGWERCAVDYQVQRTGFPWLGIELVVAGSGEVQLGGRWHALRPGACFSYGPGVRHTIRSDRRRPAVKYFLDLAGSEAWALARSADLAPGTVAYLAEPASPIACLDALIDAGRRSGPQRTALCTVLARAVLLALADVPRSDAEAGAAHATYLRCRRVIEEADGAIASVVEAARRCAVSTAYLGRLFQRHDGRTVYDVIRLIRLRQAADLLRESGATVSGVAERLGYANPFHFSRAFKRLYGTPPSRLRW